MNPPASKAQIPPSPHQSCPFIRAQTYNISRIDHLEASIKYEELKRQQLQNQELQTADPMTKFMYALKAKESKRQYPRRFKMFLDFLGLEGTINEQAKQFLENTKRNPQWTEDEFMDFVSFQLQRVSRGEIAESTIKNYYRPNKLFCEMNGCAQMVNWKMISRGLPKGRQAANDRAPTMEEIQRLIQYPDRRIKSIVSTMVSSGIRIGAWDYLRWKHVMIQIRYQVDRKEKSVF